VEVHSNSCNKLLVMGMGEKIENGGVVYDFGLFYNAT